MSKRAEKQIKRLRKMVKHLAELVGSIVTILIWLRLLFSLLSL